MKEVESEGFFVLFNCVMIFHIGCVCVHENIE